VNWLKNENGISFDARGIVYGPVEFRDSDQIPLLGKNEPFSVELWLSPGSDGHGRFSTIFGLYDDRYQEIFSFSQVKSLLNISNYQNTLKKESTHNWRWINNAFSKGQMRFIAITSDKTSTTVYLDGKKTRRCRNFSLILNKELTPKWRMVVGNDPTGKKPWVGKIFGLAIYNHILSPEQVGEHYKNWKGESVSSLLKEKKILALYPMDEQNGKLIHNVLDDRYHLSIPAGFKILKKNFLKLSDNALKLKGSSLQDMCINILGFIPLGFLIYLVLNVHHIFSKATSWQRIMLAVIGGTAISLMVEILQAYLPTRNSSLSDLIFNSFGTGIGVILALITLRLKTRFQRASVSESQ